MARVLLGRGFPHREYGARMSQVVYGETDGPAGRGAGRQGQGTALEATQGQMDGLFSQLPYKCHLEEVASVGE